MTNEAAGHILLQNSPATEVPMRPVYALALAIGLVALGGAATADEAADKQALKDLEGSYVLIALEGKGLKLTEEDFKKIPEADRKIVIKDSKIISYFGGKEDPGELKLDAAQKPGHMDVSSTKGGKTEVNYGIYKYADGVLTVCALEKGEAKDRPKEFKVEGKEIMMTLRKQKKDAK